MRSRHTTIPHPPSVTSQSLNSINDDELKKKQNPPPQRSKFRLPPPPKLLASGDADKTARRISSGSVDTSNVNTRDEEMGGSSSISNAVPSSQLPAPPCLPIPPSHPEPAMTTAPYQRKLSSTTPSNKANSDIEPTNTISTTAPSTKPYKNNPYQTHQPSPFYSHSRRLQKLQRRLHDGFILLIAIISLILLWWHHVNLKPHHHKKHRHHHKHEHLHAMIGIIDNPAGFALYSAPIHDHHQSTNNNNNINHDEVESDELFSQVSTITLSNSHQLPQVGFAVGGSVQHKEIPLIVSRLLQYASSEREGGGGIALIDADSGVDHNGGVDGVESGMVKTVVALVGRAIHFFAKEGDRIVDAKDSTTNSYDYENRLEVHLLISLTQAEFGKEATLKAMQELTAELDGLVPPIHDLDNLDSTSWKANIADRRVDTRLHVLLHSPECFDDMHQIIPCSLDEVSNLQLLQKWIDSWGILERLYESNILHGIGVDRTTEADLNLLLKHCSITPHMYRGDVSQALDGYGRKIGDHSIHEYHRVGPLLRDKNITFLASNVAGHVLERKEMAPNAFGLLEVLGKSLFYSHREMMVKQNGSLQLMSDSSEDYYTVPRLALAYLVRHGVVALPHAYKPEHLADDSPESVGGLANFLQERHVAEIGVALKALVTGRDLPEDHGLGFEDKDAVAVVFHNKMDQDVILVHHSDYGKDFTEEKGSIEGGDSSVFMAKTGDRFEAYLDGRKVGTYQVHANKGGADDFTISGSND